MEIFYGLLALGLSFAHVTDNLMSFLLSNNSEEKLAGTTDL
jgi:hypothetical protein